MKILKKLNLFFFIGMLALASCSKEKGDSEKRIESKSEQVIDVESLAKSAYSVDLTKEEEENYIRLYQKLNVEQLKEFNRLCNEIIIEKQSVMLKGHHLDSFLEEQEETQILQDEFINESLKVFNKPYNQLNEKERSIFSKKKIKTKDEEIDLSFNSCPEHDFSGGTAWYVDANSGTLCHGLHPARHLGQTDCDYEFYYFGMQYKWYAKPWLVRTALMWWGGGLGCRFSNGVSALLVGNRGVIAAGGANAIRIWCLTNP